MHVTPIIAFGAQFIRARVHLGERRGFTALQQVDQRVDREGVVEINGERVVVVGQHDPARQPTRRAPALKRVVLRRSAAGLLQGADVVARDAPGGAGEDQPSIGDAGQKRQRRERAPVPGAAVKAALGLEQAQKAIDVQRAPREVVRARQPGHDATPEPTRTQNEAVAGEAQREIGDRNLLIRRGPGATEIRNLAAAEHRAKEDVAEAALGEVHHFGEDRVRIERLFLAQMRGHVREQIGIGVAEAAKQVGARRAADVNAAARERPCAASPAFGRDERRHDGAGVRQGWHAARSPSRRCRRGSAPFPAVPRSASGRRGGAGCVSRAPQGSVETGDGGEVEPAQQGRRFAFPPSTNASPTPDSSSSASTSGTSRCS